LSGLQASGGDGVEDFGLFWGVLLSVGVQVEPRVRQELPEEQNRSPEQRVKKVFFHGVKGRRVFWEGAGKVPARSEVRGFVPIRKVRKRLKFLWKTPPSPL